MLAASSLGPHWPESGCWKMETVGHQGMKQVEGSTGPLALLHTRPRPALGPTMAPAWPDSKFSHRPASQARAGAAPG